MEHGIDIKSVRSAHFIGIGGIGMSALSRYYKTIGKKVSGSDAVDSELMRELNKEGINTIVGQTPENISTEIDLVIHTQAIPASNPEFKEAKKQNKPILSYNQALGLLTKEKFTIAVAGTHGKSTTTAMLALTMVAGGLDPTVIIGTKLKEFGGSNFRYGKSNFLLIEACEYRRSFLDYYPHIIVLPNVDLDHLDYFKDEADYVKAFASFVKKVPHTGYLIANGDDKNIKKLIPMVKGFSIDPTFKPDHFVFDREKFAYPTVGVPGMHNRVNASLAYMTGKILNIPEHRVLRALEGFTGTWRRFENKGKLKSGANLYDDYGHHPTEIEATLQGTRELFPGRNIIAVFQPHQFSRTHHFLKEFGTAFREADMIIIPDIYEARDSKKDKQTVSVDRLVEEIAQQGKEVKNGQGLEQTARWLEQNTTEKEVVITMGAGNIHLIYTYLDLV